MNLGPGEILLIVVAILLIFGPSKLPRLARSLGRAQGEFRKGLRDDATEDNEDEQSSPSKLS